MDCYTCENEATRQCRRCARVYCDLHGGDLCGECLNPVSTLPSFNLYRGSLLALLIATAVALWLLVRPPGSGDGEEVVIANATPTAIETLAPTDEAETPEDTTPTPRATGTAEPGETPTDEGPVTYTVVDGDTLLGIAEQFAPAGIEPLTYAQQIADASGLASVDSPINPGQTLVLP